MPLAWRIVKAKYANSAFSGEGAAKTGGRWNPRGIAVIYTSGTLSLAALETLVHLVPPVTAKYVTFQLQFDKSLIETASRQKLLANWNAEPPGDASTVVGAEWIRGARTPVLAVPSAIVPSEVNYLLNPAHADFGKIAVGPPKPFVFDPRLLS
jgi:RES domain-containing protein